MLSKPLRRRSFVLGKYLGIFWTVLVTFTLLGTLLLVIVAYKPIYDATETSQQEPIWQVCHFEMVGVVPGLVLAFMEVAILAAISVAISTRLPMIANFIICFSIYVIGHLTPLLVQTSVEKRNAGSGRICRPVAVHCISCSRPFQHRSRRGRWRRCPVQLLGLGYVVQLLSTG